MSAARLISGLTMLSRILGLVRDMVCLRYFGTAVWDSFAIPFQIPNLFRRLFGEGALSAALIPIYTDLRHHDADAAQGLVRRVVTLLTVILSGITLVGLVLIYAYWRLRGGGPEVTLTAQLTAIMLPFAILICLVATLGGVLNVHGHFAAPAAAPIILNVCMISAVGVAGIFGGQPDQQIFAVAWAVLLAGVLELLLQWWPLRRAGVSLYPEFARRDPHLRRIGKLMAPMVLGMSVMQFNALMDSVITRLLSATAATGPTFEFFGRTIAYPAQEGAVSALYLAQRLYQLPLGVFGIAISTAIFPLLSATAARRDLAGFARTLNEGLRVVLFIGLPAALGLIIVRLPLARIFQGGRFDADDVAQTAWTLLFYALGIGAYFLQHMIVRGFYAFQDSVTPVKIAVRIVALNLLLNVVLIWPLGPGGVALSTAVCSVLQVILLLRVMTRRYDLTIRAGVGASLAKTSLATVVMAAVTVAVLRLTADLHVSLQLTAAVGAAMFSYLAVARLLRSAELSIILRRSRP